jgi:hypothetical protein
MAVAREIPKCFFCGKPIAKGIYKDQSKIPFMFRTIGDSFIRWEFHECNCKGAKAARKKARESAKKIAESLKNDPTLKNLFKTNPP